MLLFEKPKALMTPRRGLHEACGERIETIWIGCVDIAPRMTRGQREGSSPIWLSKRIRAKVNVKNFRRMIEQPSGPCGAIDSDIEWLSLAKANARRAARKT